MTAATVLPRRVPESPTSCCVTSDCRSWTGTRLRVRIRADPTLAPILVALTGYAREEDARMAMQAGFDHHLAKPLNSPSLKTCSRVFR